MTLEQKLKQLQDEARALRRKRQDSWTDRDVARANELAKEIDDAETAIKNRDAATDAVRALDGTGGSEHSPREVEGETDTSIGRQFRSQARKSQPAGALALVDETRTGKFTGSVMKAFKAAAPTIGGPFSTQKTLIPNGAVSAEFNGVIVESPEGQKTLLDAIGRDEIAQPCGTYMRQTVATHNAATVAREALKLTSEYSLDEVPFEVATTAHLTPGLPRQHFQDYEGLEAFVANQMTYGVQRAITDALLNGGTTESGDTFKGILTTTGVGQTTYVTSAVASVRRALRKLQVAGVRPSGIAMRPTDWEAIELSLDATHWAGGGTPTEAAPPRLFGLPVLLDAAIPEGQAIVGDWSTISLLYRNGMDIRWTENGAQDGQDQTVDMFSRNLLYFRAEVRIAPIIASPPSIRVVELASGSYKLAAPLFAFLVGEERQSAGAW